MRYGAFLPNRARRERFRAREQRAARGERAQREEHAARSAGRAPSVPSHIDAHRGERAARLSTNRADEARDDDGVERGTGQVQRGGV